MVKPRCLEPTAHYLCTPEPGRLGWVISKEKGVTPVNATSAEVTGEKSSLLYMERRFNIYSII